MKDWLIGEIPQFGLVELKAAVSDAIRWHVKPPITREERVQRDNAFVRLRQAEAHIDIELHKRQRAA